MDLYKDLLGTETGVCSKWPKGDENPHVVSKSCNIHNLPPCGLQVLDSDGVSSPLLIHCNSPLL